MSLDAFSVVVGFLAAVEAVLGGAAAVLGAREARTPPEPEAEARRPLLALTGAALVAVALAGVPLLYLLMASWVPRWPGVMCVEGVRRIGMGTTGAVRFLPDLVVALDATKLLVVFLAGAWAVLRRAPGAPAARAAALALAALGLVAALDGAAALAYVAIPKEEVYPAAGCCTVALPGGAREAGLTRAGSPGEGGSGPLAAGFIAAAVLLGIGAGLLRRFPASGRGRTAALSVLAALAAASLPLASGFLDDVAAPRLLGLPWHHCRWCAFARAPVSLVGTVLFLGAAFAAGWAQVSRLSRGGGDGGEGPGPRLLGAAALAFLGAAGLGAVAAWAP